MTILVRIDLKRTQCGFINLEVDSLDEIDKKIKNKEYDLNDVAIEEDFSGDWCIDRATNPFDIIYDNVDDEMDFEEGESEKGAFTDEELFKIDVVNNTAYNAVCNLLGLDPNTQELSWDMEWIGGLSDLLTEFICKNFDKNEQDVYPYREI